MNLEHLSARTLRNVKNDIDNTLYAKGENHRKAIENAIKAAINDGFDVHLFYEGGSNLFFESEGSDIEKLGVGIHW